MLNRFEEEMIRRGVKALETIAKNLEKPKLTEEQIYDKYCADCENAVFCHEECDYCEPIKEMLEK